MKANEIYLNKLKKCESIQQVFDITQEHYETNAKMGAFAGAIVKNKIPEIIFMLNLKEKK